VNTFSSLVTPADVLLDLDVADADGLFRAIGARWNRVRDLTDADVAECLRARETLGSTALGEGVAIPHARIAGLALAVAAVVRLARPIPFNAPDNLPIDTCLVLLVPEAATEEHLRILGEAAEMLSLHRFREQLKACKNADEVIALLGTSRGRS